jgi:hypothetical protein
VRTASDRVRGWNRRSENASLTFAIAASTSLAWRVVQTEMQTALSPPSGAGSDPLPKSVKFFLVGQDRLELSANASHPSQPFSTSWTTERARATSRSPGEQHRDVPRSRSARDAVLQQRRTPRSMRLGRTPTSCAKFDAPKCHFGGQRSAGTATVCAGLACRLAREVP